MSSSDVELVRSLIQGWNQAADPRLDLYTDDAEFDFDGWGFAVSGSFTGVEHLSAALREIQQTWEEIKLEPVEFTEAGDCVVVEALFYLRQRGSGLQVSDSASLVYSLVDGRIARLEIHRDHELALAAAGLRPLTAGRH
jgi:ketosteroid isomerase-like protein